MKKEEFLSLLRSKLNGLPKEDIDNRIAFYEEMIEDRVDEGKSEEEAIEEIGSVDDIVSEIAKDTPLLKLVKEKVKPARSLRPWEIVLIIISFPFWLPFLIVAAVLGLVGYILSWILVIVTYAVELSLIVAAIGGIVIFFASIATGGEFSLIPLGISFLAAGLAFLFYFACVGATKLTIKITKKIFTKIKTAIIKKGS